uniref:Amino acid transporter transmembrane domain-containing protein n=1 Tax=Strongyloides stercoralis TaxID=6248 RepID=A0A0K0E4W8_STRER
MDGQMYYRCCGRNFNTFTDASKYSLKKQCTVKFGRNIIQTFNKSASPNEVRKSTLITTENILPVAPKKSCVKTMYSTKCLGKNALSYKIWLLVWSDIGPTYYNDALLSMFKTKFLKEVNLYRKLHGSPPLSDNHKYLSAVAQQNANLLAKQKTLLHFSSKIFSTIMGSIKHCYMSFLMKIWYDEIKYFDFKKNHFNIMAEEFSAMVWKNSRYLGVGIATSDSKVYVVLKFFPKGNDRNQFKSNIRNVIMNKAEK